MLTVLDAAKHITVFDVAKYILEQGLPNMTHKKLQKLCYYVQAWSLAVRGVRMMDCEFEAWVHGPVCRELYNYFKFGLDVDKVNALKTIEIAGTDAAEFTDIVLRMYGKYTGSDLEVMTHAELPWKEARRGLHYWELSSNVISEDLMATYYLNELKEATRGQ